jgi:hypothetical protein
MYNQDLAIQHRIDSLKDQLETIQNDFRDNLKPVLLKYEYHKLTPALLKNIQGIINYFLERNQLKISVCVNLLNENLIIFGSTLIDELVWEQIQQCNV